MRGLTVLAIAGIAAVVCGCAPSQGNSGPIDAPSDPQETPTSMASIGEVPGDLLDAITSEAAERAGVEADEVAIITAEAVTWSDGSLGCPEPGMMYTQALVEGSRITLRAGDRTYEYHAGGQRAPFYCENPTQ